MNRSRRPVRIAATALLLAFLLPVGVAGQTPGEGEPPAWAALHDALVASQRAHLWRVAVWGGSSLVAGLALAATAGEGAATRRGFGIQTAAWGAVNLGIVAWGLTSASPAPPADWLGAWAAEDRWAHLLLVNLGLNVGYMAVGSALWVASGRGLRSGDAVRGHAVAVVLQGTALLALDGVAWWAGRERMEALGDLAPALLTTAGAVPGALGLGVSIPWPG